MSDVVVWKHELRGEVNDLQLHLLAEVLAVDEQAGRIQLWEMHGVEQVATATRRFRLVGTGHPFPESAVRRFIGSVLVHGGTYVFHVFEEGTA